jgi:hypothetical protein
MSAPWFVWSSVRAHELPPALAGSYGPYGSWIIGAYREFPGLLATVVRANIGSAIREAGVVMFGAFPAFTRTPLLCLLIACTVLGLCLSRRRTIPLVTVLLSYLMLVLVWPYTPGRFIWTYFPLYALAVAAAVRSMTRRARYDGVWRIPRTVAVAVACAALLSVVRYDVRGFMGGWHRLAIEPMANGVVAPVRWIAEHTAPHDTIASDVHLQAYLYAGRIGVPINSLTVREYVVPKTDSARAHEYDAIDATYHPQWWIATSMTNERAMIAQWASAVGRQPRFVTTFPDNGLAVRLRGH